VDISLVVNVMDCHDKLSGVVARNLFAKTPSSLYIVKQLAIWSQLAKNYSHFFLNAVILVILFAQDCHLFAVNEFYYVRIA
jgi:hypothetical protein